MKKIKKIKSLLLCTIMILINSIFVIKLSTVPANAETSGSCGANLTWNLNTDTGELTISGTGTMTNWIHNSHAPWSSSRSYIKSVFIGIGVTSIGSYSFYSCASLTSITIPNSVTYIGSNVFYRCTGLTNITIPDSVTYIGSDAFNDTAWYNNQPEGLVYAGKVAYKYNGTFPANVSIQEGTIGIARHAFYNCAELTSVTIPDSVTTFGAGAFYGCTGLTSVTIGNGVTSISSSAFYGCTGLTSITIGNSVTSIENYAFYDCKMLEDVYYKGTADQKDNIIIETYNASLRNATWHYNWVEPQFTTHSLVLTGEIGVNFFVDFGTLTEEEKSASYMTFTVGGEAAKTAYYSSTAVNDSGKYRFTCYVSSVQMAESIVPTLHYGDNGAIIGESYSVKQYIDYVVDNSGDYTEKTVTLVKALGDYGHYSQIYLKAQHPELTFTALPRYRDADYASFEEYLTALSANRMEKGIVGTSVTEVAYNLNLDSTITVNVKLSANESLNASGSFDGRTIAGSETDDVTLLRVAGILITQLGETITVTGAGSANTAEFTVALSGLSYIRAILSKETASVAAKNAMAALYEYYLAAIAY